MNNPLRFTDLTGDTVDIDPNLLKPVPDREYDDLTTEDQTRLQFQKFWQAYGEEIMTLFCERGKYGKTKLNFKLGSYPASFLGIPYSPDFYGHTSWGKQGTNEKDFEHGGDKEVTAGFGVDELVANIYLHPNNARPSNELRSTGYDTPEEEYEHFRLIFLQIQKGKPVMTTEHEHVIINLNQVPKIK